MSNTIRLLPQAGDIMLAAPRQVWLATLGAAALTRHWAETKAGTTFRTLVREGSAVESIALRRVSEGVDTSVKRASRLARSARHGVGTTLASVADMASTFVRAKLPAMRARIDIERAAAPRKNARKPVKRKATKRASRRTATK
jgi:hypothetical protein